MKRDLVQMTAQIVIGKVDTSHPTTHSYRTRWRLIFEVHPSILV